MVDTLQSSFSGKSAAAAAFLRRGGASGSSRLAVDGDGLFVYKRKSLSR